MILWIFLQNCCHRKPFHFLKLRLFDGGWFWGICNKITKIVKKTPGKILFIYFLTIVGRLNFRFFHSIGWRYSNEMSPNGPQAAAMLLSLGSSTSIDNVAESHIKGWEVS